MNVNDSVLSGNSASFRGGVIANLASSTLYVTDSILSGNSVARFPGAGGAIFNRH